MQIAEYVLEREGELYVGTTRVTLHSVVADWKRGRTPEQIAADFPSIPLVAVCGAITTYLERHDELDWLFAEHDEQLARERAVTEAAHAEFYAEMRARLAKVRPAVQSELRAHGILPESESATDAPNTPTAPSSRSADAPTA